MAFKDYIALPITRDDQGAVRDANGAEDWDDDNQDQFERDIVAAVNTFDKMLDELKAVRPYAPWPLLQRIDAVIAEAEGKAS